MYDIKWIRDHAGVFDEGLRKRHVAPLSGLLLTLDDARKAAISRLQAVQERRKAASKEIAQAIAKNDMTRVAALKGEVNELKIAFARHESAEKAAIAALDKALAEVPNLPLAEVPIGVDEHGNVEIRRYGTPPHFADGFVPKEHFDIGEALGMMDFDTAANLSGTRFVVLTGQLARLERALAAFMLDLHTGEHGYTEVNPPLLVKDHTMFGTAHLPKFADDQFMASSQRSRDERLHEALDHASEDDVARFKHGAITLKQLVDAALHMAPTHEDFWLIPTAEVPLTNLVRQRILDDRDLPLRFTACTPCFRAEAGAAGRDTRGMIRQHQFSKVELVSITTPDKSLDEHQRMTACAESVVKKLGLPFRTVVLCTGDMGFSAQKTYDIEVWLPGQGKFREISSCSVCGDFQARRMGARYRAAGHKQPQYVHTLNGSGVAVGRALVAVVETYQNPDGSTTVPDVLVPYMGGVKRIGHGTEQ